MDWLTSGKDAVDTTCLRRLVQRGEAAEVLATADYLLCDGLRREIQRALLHARLSDQESARLTGDQVAATAFDPIATLLEFQRSGADFKLFERQDRSEQRALCDAARGLSLQVIPLSQHGLPRAVAVAKPGVWLDIDALVSQRGPPRRGRGRAAVRVGRSRRTSHS